MVYARRCPLCGADYHPPIRGRAAVGVVSEFRHLTLRAEPGGTPGPGPPGSPGRLLTLRCLVCRGAYVWDYFAGQGAVADVDG
jgi:hypothetical protein